MSLTRSIAGGLALLLVSARLGAAQVPDTSAKHRTPLLTHRELIIGGALVAGTVALMPADDWFHAQWGGRTLQSNSTLHGAADDFSLLGDPGTVILTFGTYAVGRLAGKRTVASVGLHASEALLLSAAATELVKGVAGRNRPYLPSPDADDFTPLHGFTGAGHTSFPSGHTSAAFAVASVVAQEGTVHWPHAARFVTPASYGLATLVGVSRLYKDRHWTSDVLMGAIVGEYSGLVVERYNQGHSHNPLERWLLPSAVATTGNGGVAVVWALH